MPEQETQKASDQQSPTFLWVPWMLVFLIGITWYDSSLFVITIIPILLLVFVAMIVFPIRLVRKLTVLKSFPPRVPTEQVQVNPKEDDR